MKKTLNYLGKDWEVDSFLDFASQVQKFHKPNFVTGWAVGLSETEYNTLSVIYESIQLKALANYWRSNA